jgi:hypothetical protein
MDQFNHCVFDALDQPRLPVIDSFESQIQESSVELLLNIRSDLTGDNNLTERDPFRAKAKFIELLFYNQFAPVANHIFYVEGGGHLVLQRYAWNRHAVYKMSGVIYIIPAS